jgi:hypothetical protein
MVTSEDGRITANHLNNPVPQRVEQPAASKLGLNSEIGHAIAPWDSRYPNGYTQQYNLSVDRELPRGLLVDAAFVESRIPDGVHFRQVVSFHPGGSSGC